MDAIVITLSTLSLGAWIYLVCFRGRFWKADQRLAAGREPLPTYPSVAAIVPARNEAELIGASLASLLGQDYPGPYEIILVDDQSRDGTGQIASRAAGEVKEAKRLKVLTSRSLPAGWTGKLWAMEQGLRYLQGLESPPEYILFTDADIRHARHNVRDLAQHAEAERLQLASLMVRLNCTTFWEKLLLPAFVFFFQKLFPFPWVNRPRSRHAAAAGGCILVRREALARIGGLQSIRGNLIDDCALARAVKRGNHPIWLGLTETTCSLRSYPSLGSIREMIARTAFVQLNRSFVLLGLTLIGMALLYPAPAAALIWGILNGNWPIITISVSTGLLMLLAYAPTLRLYRLSPAWGALLPVIGVLYALMTLDSAVKHLLGRGGGWKGRTYSAGGPGAAACGGRTNA